LEIGFVFYCGQLFHLIQREAKPIPLKVFEKMPETKKTKQFCLNAGIWVSIAIQLVLGG
jgi:hypothetical protein